MLGFMVGAGPVLATENGPMPVVPNGSFELNTTDGGSAYQPLYDGFAGLPGWRFSTAPSPVLIGTPDEAYPYATPFGRWQLDLSGSDNTTGGWVEADLTGLVAGRDYRVSFAVGVSTAFLGGGGAPALRVSVAAASADFTVPPAGIIDWTAREVVFRAAGESAVLRFTNVSPTGTGFISVDNVAVAPVAVAQTVSLLRQPDGRLRLDYEGTLESSDDLRIWIPEPNLPSGAVLAGDGAGRFFRAVGD